MPDVLHGADPQRIAAAVIGFFGAAVIADAARVVRMIRAERRELVAGFEAEDGNGGNQGRGERTGVGLGKVEGDTD